MGSLRDMKIIPDNAITEALNEPEIKKLSAELGGWDLIRWDGENRLQRKFKFKDFSQALAFTNQVGALAEKENHHPSILTEWGKVTISWWTHKLHGLHQNDFVMASRTDELYERR
jgi:4a-hydroxytetrahydrobiopterin dehydratase